MIIQIWKVFSVVWVGHSSGDNLVGKRGRGGEGEASPVSKFFFIIMVENKFSM
jgi:hypothetical protein